jgi:hypothetical protein
VEAGVELVVVYVWLVVEAGVGLVVVCVHAWLVVVCACVAGGVCACVAGGGGRGWAHVYKHVHAHPCTLRVPKHVGNCVWLYAQSSLLAHAPEIVAVSIRINQACLFARTVATSIRKHKSVCTHISTHTHTHTLTRVHTYSYSM